MNICRFCGKYAHEDQHKMQLVQYGIRHHAHPDCLLQKKGADAFDLLAKWQLEKFPALAAMRHGLFDVLGQKIGAAK